MHEVAQVAAPESRVVYVDHDPIVLAHARALLTSTPEGRTAYIEADLRNPKAILASPAVAQTLDLSRPVALMLVAVLHFISFSDRRLRRTAFELRFHVLYMFATWLCGLGADLPGSSAEVLPVPGVPAVVLLGMF